MMSVIQNLAKIDLILIAEQLQGLRKRKVQFE